MRRRELGPLLGVAMMTARILRAQQKARPEIQSYFAVRCSRFPTMA